jgi:dTDP-4-dehydrorhamnose 3,5-epimerase
LISTNRRQPTATRLGASERMKGVMLTPLKRIPLPAGDVLHGMKEGEPGYAGFGEAYFSIVHLGTVKGWKRHNRMTLNLVVPVGRVGFAICDDRSGSPSFQTVTLSPDDDATYQRLTVSPGLWVAFRGEGGGLNMLLNLASIRHDPAEGDNKPLSDFPFHWPEIA